MADTPEHRGTPPVQVPQPHSAAKIELQVGHMPHMIELIHSHHEPIEHLGHLMDKIDFGNKVAVAVAGTQAFRRYNALTGAIGLNSIGNLIGMVRSAKWRLIIQHIDEASPLGKSIESMGFLAGRWPARSPLLVPANRKHHRFFRFRKLKAYG